MNKIALLTAAAVLVSAPALADNYRKSDKNNNAHRHTERVMKSERTILRSERSLTTEERKALNDGAEHVYISNPQEPDNQARRGSTLIVSEHRKGHPQTFNLESGGRVQIDGTQAYLLTDGGMRYFAPNSSYKATNGVTFVVENGVVIRAESPADVVVVDTVM